jgi:hypothetical protein
MFSRRWIINYFLLVLIIIFTWIGINNPITEDQKFDLDAITKLKPQQIETIRIETADGSVALEKKENRWFISSPYLWFADHLAVERIASLVSSKYHSKLPKSEIELSTLGLTIPKAVITLNQTSIYFGSTNQIGSRRYLLIDPTLYLVDDIHFALIDRGISGLIDKRLLPEGSGLQTLKFSGFSISHQDSGWVSSKTQQPDDKAKQIISNWQNQQASRVTTYDQSLTPLDKITATLKGDENIEFYLLAITPEIILARPDINLQFHFQDHLYYELLSLDEAPAK